MNELKEILFEACNNAEVRSDAAYQNLMTHEDFDQKFYRALKEAHAAYDALYSVIKEAGLIYEYFYWEQNRKEEHTNE